ncbi:MAG TPA: hypothetical protein VGF75_03765, partial [Candidatus Saccharimonadales bacterium]
MSDKWSPGRIIANIKKGGSNPFLRILAIIVLALLLVGSYHVYKDIWPTEYVATQDGFKIVFPSAPTVNKLAPQKTSSGVEDSGNIYSVTNKTKGTDYVVYVTSYSKESFNSLSESSRASILEDEIE